MKIQKRFPWIRLGRGGKIIRNLCLAVGIVLGIWFGLGCPPWTAEGALRRMEREMLLSPGETVGWNGHNQVLVMSDDYAYTGTVYNNNLFWKKAALYQGAAREDGPQLLSFPRGTTELSGYAAVLLWGPEDAERAELKLNYDYEIRICQVTEENWVDWENPIDLKQAAGEYVNWAEKESEEVFWFDFQPDDAQERAALNCFLWEDCLYSEESGARENRYNITAARGDVNFYDQEGRCILTVPVEVNHP